MGKLANPGRALFSVKNHGEKTILSFLGVKLKLKNKDFHRETAEAIVVQDSYNLEALQQARKAILFLVPNNNKILGGIIAIFHLHKLSRELQNDALCLIATHPGKLTYAQNDKLGSDEPIYRWEQITTNGHNIRELILHIPEYYAKLFYNDLKINERQFLKAIPDLKINILNQNIELMPEPEQFKSLYDLTSTITQTTGFERYTTQEVCNKFGLPVYRVPSFIDLNNCVKKDFEGKKKLILYSRDPHPMKAQILQHLKAGFPDWELREIKDLAYSQFLELIAEALFCISFGEGFDGYYIQPYYAKSIGISVYNDTFFIAPEIKTFPFVYESYEQLYEKITGDIKSVYSNKNAYEQIALKTHNYLKNTINKKENTSMGLEKFYKGEPTFIPELKRVEENP